MQPHSAATLKRTPWRAMARCRQGIDQHEHQPTICDPCEIPRHWHRTYLKERNVKTLEHKNTNKKSDYTQCRGTGTIQARTERNATSLANMNAHKRFCDQCAIPRHWHWTKHMSTLIQISQSMLQSQWTAFGASHSGRKRASIKVDAVSVDKSNIGHWMCFFQRSCRTALLFKILGTAALS